MKKNNQLNSQTIVDQTILDLLGDLKIKTPDDLIKLRELIQSSLEFKPYNEETKEHADSIQWKRTASQIISDGYVYKGRACSDLAIVFLTLCKAAGLDGYLVKLISLDKTNSHSIVEIKLNGEWYRIDPSMKDSVPFKGQLTDDQIWNKNWLGGWKVWKRGRDLWDLELGGIEDEKKVCKM